MVGSVDRVVDADLVRRQLDRIHAELSELRQHGYAQPDPSGTEQRLHNALAAIHAHPARELSTGADSKAAGRQSYEWSAPAPADNVHCGAAPEATSLHASKSRRPASARTHARPTQKPAHWNDGLASARSTSSLPVYNPDPTFRDASVEHRCRTTRPKSALGGGFRPCPAGHRSTPQLHAGERGEEWEENAPVYHQSKPLAPPASPNVIATLRGFPLGRRSSAFGGGWKPAPSGTRRALGANQPPGYRCLSCNLSSPAYSMASKVALSRDVDPYLADDFPGPGQYDYDYSSMARRPGGPAYTMRPRIVLNPNMDPFVVDTAGPGPGAYNTTKY